MPKFLTVMALAIAFMATGFAVPSYAEEEKQVCCHFLVQPEKGGTTPGCMRQSVEDWGESISDAVLHSWPSADVFR